MRMPSPALVQIIALTVGLFLLTKSIGICAEVEPARVEWSISTPPFAADPRSFLALAIQLQNQVATPQTLRLHFDLGPLRSLSGSDVEVPVGPNEKKTTLITVYIPPEAPGGSNVQVTASAEDGTVRTTSIGVSAVANCKVTAETTDRRFVYPGEKAVYQIKIVNTGNIPLHCALRPSTSPPAASTSVTADNLFIPVGGNAEAGIEVATSDKLLDFTTFATSVEIETAEMRGDASRQFLYFNTETFPRAAPAERTRLFETLSGSISIGLGAGGGNESNRHGGDEVLRETLTLEGLIWDTTRFQLIEAFTYPTDGNGNQSAALSSLPGGSTRNFFHLGLYNPYYDVEGGETTTEPARLLSSRETGDGVRVAVRPYGNDDLQVQAFAEENTLTLNRKDVFGATISGKLPDSPLEFWRVGTLSKRGDVGPQGRHWDTIGIDTGWKIPLTIPLRAEFSVAAGENSNAQSGYAWLAGLHYNRAAGGEPDTSPLKAGVEFASGGKGFPGTQNGRDDKRAYVSFRFSVNPTYAEAYANYNDSTYKVVPNIEKTLEEEQSLLPDFLLTSQSRLITAGVRWKRSDSNSDSWNFPSGSAEFQETTLFNKSNFFDRSNERAVALNLQPFDRLKTSANDSDWRLNIIARGGDETHESGGIPKRDSQFLTAGADLNYNRPAPAFLQNIAGPGAISAEFSGRYTQNLDNDDQALNRTGIALTAAASWQTELWSAKAGTTLYSYAAEGMSDRIWASITKKIGKKWWAGIEGAYTHRGRAQGSGERANELAVLLTFRHDFEIPVPWLPRRGQVVGEVFDDVNNNGRQDPDEPGLAGVKVSVGKNQALTDKSGEFSLPPMPDGSYPVVVTSPSDVHFNENSDHPTETADLKKGVVTELAIGMTKPTTCEGRVQFTREPSEVEVVINDQLDDLSGLEITCTDSAGRVQRSATRADGFFAIYLQPGNYEVKINPATLKPQQNVSPEKLAVKVEHTRIENLAFTVLERPKRIRKTFSEKIL